MILFMDCIDQHMVPMFKQSLFYSNTISYFNNSVLYLSKSLLALVADSYDPSMPHEITSGGLYKEHLMEGKGHKIISKKRHELGLKMYKMNKSKLTPFRPRQD